MALHSADALVNVTVELTDDIPNEPYPIISDDELYGFDLGVVSICGTSERLLALGQWLIKHFDEPAYTTYLEG